MSEQPKIVTLGTIDFDRPILDLMDQPIQQGRDGEEAAPMRLGDACVNALMYTPPEDSTTGTEKLKRFNLAMQIRPQSDGEYQQIAVSSKNKTEILRLAEAIYGTLVYGRIYEALEGTTETNED